MNINANTVAIIATNKLYHTKYHLAIAFDEIWHIALKSSDILNKKANVFG